MQVRVSPPPGRFCGQHAIVIGGSISGLLAARVLSAHFDRVTVLDPPTPRQGARRVWSDSKGNIWVAEWNAGQLSRYDPKTSQWKAWKPPGERPQVLLHPGRRDPRAALHLQLADQEVRRIEQPHQQAAGSAHQQQGA